MIKEFVATVVLGDARGYRELQHKELEREMANMASKKKHQKFDNPYGFHQLSKNPLPEIAILPRKLRTTTDWILEYIEFNTQGLGDVVVEIKFRDFLHEGNVDLHRKRRCSVHFAIREASQILPSFLGVYVLIVRKLESKEICKLRDDCASPRSTIQVLVRRYMCWVGSQI